MTTATPSAQFNARFFRCLRLSNPQLPRSPASKNATDMGQHRIEYSIHDCWPVVAAHGRHSRSEFDRPRPVESSLGSLLRDAARPTTAPTSSRSSVRTAATRRGNAAVHRRRKRAVHDLEPQQAVGRARPQGEAGKACAARPHRYGRCPDRELPSGHPGQTRHSAWADASAPQSAADLRGHLAASARPGPIASAAASTSSRRACRA